MKNAKYGRSDQRSAVSEMGRGKGEARKITEACPFGRSPMGEPEPSRRGAEEKKAENA